MLRWTKAQWDAYGRHIGTYIGGIVTGLITFGLITQTDGATLVAALNDIMDGTGKIVAGLATIAGIVGPMYTAWKAARSASPEKQAEQTVKNLQAGTPINGEKKKLIEAVAEQPEVKKVVMTTPEEAYEIPSNKVTSA